MPKQHFGKKRQHCHSLASIWKIQSSNVFERLVNAEHLPEAFGLFYRSSLDFKSRVVLRKQQKLMKLSHSVSVQVVIANVFVGPPMREVWFSSIEIYTSAPVDMNIFGLSHDIYTSAPADVNIFGLSHRNHHNQVPNLSWKADTQISGPDRKIPNTRRQSVMVCWCRWVPANCKNGDPESCRMWRYSNVYGKFISGRVSFSKCISYFPCISIPATWKLSRSWLSNVVQVLLMFDPEQRYMVMQMVRVAEGLWRFHAWKLRYLAYIFVHTKHFCFLSTRIHS